MNFITRLGSQFRLDGKPYKFHMANNYGLAIDFYSRASIANLFTMAYEDGFRVFRFWAHPTSTGGPFHHLAYPLGKNLISNDWVMGADTTLSQELTPGGERAIKQTAAWGTYVGNYKLVNVQPNTDYVWTWQDKIQALAGDQAHYPPTIRVQDGITGVDFMDAGILNAPNVWTKRQVKFNSGLHTSVRLSLINFGGQNISYLGDMHLGVATTPVLELIESGFRQLDMVLDELGKAGLKAWMSLANNPDYNTKTIFVNLANAIYGTNYSTASPQTAFFDAPECRLIYKQIASDILNRKNSINGKIYKDDPVFNFIELINEGRYDVFDAEGGTQNSSSSRNIARVVDWISDVTTHIKSISTKQLIAYGDCGHTYEWVNGDTVSNGSGYGVDYKIFATISTLDILDFHLYPTQADATKLSGFGQRLGKSGGPGLTAQIQDYIKVGEANNKPVAIGEVSLLKEYRPVNQGYPLNTRFEFCKKLFSDFYDAGGDCIGWWSYSTGNAGYEFYALGSDGANANPNFDDNPLRSLFAQYAYKINGGRIPVDAIHSGVSL